MVVCELFDFLDDGFEYIQADVITKHYESIPRFCEGNQ
jgi:hypothetical protein